MLRQLWVLVLSLGTVIFVGLSPVAAEVTFVKTIGSVSSKTAAAATSITVSPAGVAPGNRIIVLLALNPASGGVSCSDSGANTYVLDRNVRNGSGTKGVRIVVLSAHAATGLSGGQTITCAHPNVSARALSASEFSGILALSAVDRKHSNTGNNASPSSGVTLKTRQADELLIGGIGVEGDIGESFTPGPGYTVLERVGTSGESAADNVTINPAYRIVNTIGAYSVTGTLATGRRWAAAIVTYRGAPAAATKLVVTSVNGGTNPIAGTGFPVVVQAQDNAGLPRNVSTNTGITLSLKNGTGALSGTLTGAIPAGSNQATITGLTYSKAESGIIITATRTSGDMLAPGDSAGFTVDPGAASALAFTTQPGSAPVGTTLPGPPTVRVTDNFGNLVTSSSAPVSIALGSNPGGATLGGTTTRNALSGIAAFSDLTINQAGTGYTLIASSPGLVSVTSGAFNVTLPSGGIIAGTVTRASNGTPIAGALVEALQGNSVVASTTTNGSGSYSISGLANGTYTVQASFTGLVPQIRTGVTVTVGGTATVDLALNFGIAIQSPVSGTVINDHSVLVTGLFDSSLGEVGINVNGYVALHDGDEFAALVPIDAQTTSLTATVKSSSGTTLASHNIAVTVQPPTTEQILFFRPSPAIALVSQQVSFTLTSLNPFIQLELDGNGDGTIDFTGTTLQGQVVTFAEPGLYYPSVKVTETGGTVRTETTIVQVLDEIQLDAMLQSKWTSMKDALRSGDINLASRHIVLRRRANYQGMFNALTVPLADIDQVLRNITPVEQRGIEVEYEMLVTEGGFQYSYMVLFALDEDGVWRIKFF
jgi:hypothetical protein